jgi:DNA-binding HxlR family transcriptional regulator
MKPQPPFNVFDDRCPTRAVLDRLADKWALLVLDRLRLGPARFNVLRREVRSVSQKMLAQVLRSLERDGLVLRTVRPTAPVTVEYSLTPLGETLTEAVAALTHWAERNMAAVEVARADFDTRRAALG